MLEPSARLRVALLAGTLGQGGAEKQLVYLARALLRVGAEVRVYSLTRGEFCEAALAAIGVGPLWVGPFANPILRLMSLTRMVRRFQPHVVQSGHMFANLYAGVIGRALRGISIGAVRSTLARARKANGLWARWLVTAPDALLVNSRKAVDELIGSRLISADRVWFLPNFIDVAEFDASSTMKADGGRRRGETCRVAFVGRLIPVKRVDRFLHALAIACGRHGALEGIVIGEGPERGRLENLAADLGLVPHRISFLGQRNDVPQLLCQCDLLMLCSDEEGFPNVILEAMAARLPVVSTPAGEAGHVVTDRVTGYIVDFDDIDGMADRIVRLAKSPELRGRLGQAGRQRVAQNFSAVTLPAQLLSIYSGVAQRRGDRRTLRTLGP